MELIDLLSPSMRSQSRLRRFAAGDLIVGEGEPGTSAFILLAGECEVLVHGEVLNRVRPGELFGEIACLEGATRTASVRAVIDGEVLELGGDALRSELRQSPALLESFLRAMAHRTRDISTRETVVRDEQRQLRRVLEGLQPSLDGFRDHPSLRIEVRWQPLTVASGDYYDILELAPSRYLCVLGDVMGHGALTAPTVGMIRGQLHESARAESRAHDLLAHLHKHMRKHGPPNTFMTLTVLILDLESRTAEFASAGPPSPSCTAMVHRPRLPLTATGRLATPSKMCASRAGASRWRLATSFSSTVTACPMQRAIRIPSWILWAQVRWRTS